MSRCASCAAPLRWERTETGKHIPLDAEPVPDGNIYIMHGVAFVIPTQPEIGDAEPEGPRFVSHFATCPNADEHRRKR